MKSFKSQTALLLHRLQATKMTLAERNIQDTSVFLGLEAHTSPCTPRTIRHHRAMVVRIVLDEQARQVEAGIDDVEANARLSVRASGWSRERARLIGLIHAERM